MTNNNSILSDRQNQIGAWISRVADQPACLWWAAKQSGLHPGIQQQIKHRFRHREIIRSDIHQAWQYLFESWDRKVNHFNNEIFDLKCETKKYGWNGSVARKYIAMTRPWLKVELSYDYKPKPPNGNDSQYIKNLLHLDVEYQPPHEFNIPDEWLAFIVSEFRQNLEVAHYLETEIGGDGLSIGFSSPMISEESPEISDNQRTRGLSGYVIKFSELFERLVEFDISIARQEFSAWLVDDEHIFARLRIWAGGKKDVVSAQAFSDIVLGLSDDAFWDRYHQRDLLLALKKRWNELDTKTQKKIEKRLLEGREKWRNGEELQKQWNACDSLNRITWLAKQGCDFTFDLQAEANRLRKIAPDWKPDNAEKAASSNEIRSGTVIPNPEYSCLLNIPLNAILSTAQKISEDNEDFLTEKDPFSGLSKECPVRALSALTLAAKHNEFPQRAWNSFLFFENRQNDKPKLSALIAERLCRIPDNAIMDFIHPASLWIQQTSTQLATQSPETFDKLILKLINVINLHPLSNNRGGARAGKDTDWTHESINSPAGKIAQAIFKEPRIKTKANSDGLPDEWRNLAYKLLNMNNDSYRYVLVIFCRNINWFYAVDPDWTEQNLLSVLDGNDKDNIDAFWSGFFMHSRIENQALFFRLKPHLLCLAKQQTTALNKYNHIQAGILLAGWEIKNNATGERWITNIEMRKQILDGGDVLGSRILWQIKDWSDS
ncbi:MAG TPA: hypothetical protein ENJ32_03885, partial [Crenotrichaceae bacterium]|nr:hypothetical protein [Crenotrichaceae bacterium]